PASHRRRRVGRAGAAPASQDDHRARRRCSTDAGTDGRATGTRTAAAACQAATDRLEALTEAPRAMTLGSRRCSWPRYRARSHRSHCRRPGSEPEGRVAEASVLDIAYGDLAVKQLWGDAPSGSWGPDAVTKRPCGHSPLTAMAPAFPLVILPMARGLAQP